MADYQYLPVFSESHSHNVWSAPLRVLSALVSVLDTEVLMNRPSILATGICRAQQSIIIICEFINAHNVSKQAESEAKIWFFKSPSGVAVGNRPRRTVGSSRTQSQRSDNPTPSINIDSKDVWDQLYRCRLVSVTLSLKQCIFPRGKTLSFEDNIFTISPCQTTKSSETVMDSAFCSLFLWSREVHKFFYRHRALSCSEE